VAPVRREQARERRQQSAIRGPQQWAPLLPSEHGQLMPQHEQLNVFGELAAPVCDQQPQHSREGAVGERKEHAPMLSSPAATGSKGRPALSSGAAANGCEARHDLVFARARVNLISNATSERR
jgi:hypothetical protein